MAFWRERGFTPVIEASSWAEAKIVARTLCGRDDVDPKAVDTADVDEATPVARLNAMGHPETYVPKTVEAA